MPAKAVQKKAKKRTLPPAVKEWIRDVKAYREEQARRGKEITYKEAMMRLSAERKVAKGCAQKPVYKGRASVGCSSTLEKLLTSTDVKRFIITKVVKVANFGVTKAKRTLVLFDNELIHLAWFDPNVNITRRRQYDISRTQDIGKHCKGVIEVTRNNAKHIMGIGDVERVTLTSSINGKNESFLFDFSNAEGRLRTPETHEEVLIKQERVKPDSTSPYYYIFANIDGHGDWGGPGKRVWYDSEGKYQYED